VDQQLVTVVYPRFPRVDQQLVTVVYPMFPRVDQQLVTLVYPRIPRVDQQLVTVVYPRVDQQLVTVHVYPIPRIPRVVETSNHGQSEGSSCISKVNSVQKMQIRTGSLGFTTVMPLVLPYFLYMVSHIALDVHHRTKLILISSDWQWYPPR
jgi:hypothetical protein